MEIDTTKPHIGRIYDYVLGGHHNFDIDRQAAKHLMELAPSYPKWARLNRWFLQLVAEQWATEGHTRILDLASGLPTQGHFHEIMPQAHILYSDNDPLSVTYGQQLLENVSTAEYILADLRDPQFLRDRASAFFGDEREVAIGLIGISYFLDDAQLAHLAQMLHDSRDDQRGPSALCYNWRSAILPQLGGDTNPHVALAGCVVAAVGAVADDRYFIDGQYL